MGRRPTNIWLLILMTVFARVMSSSASVSSLWGGYVQLMLIVDETMGWMEDGVMYSTVDQAFMSVTKVEMEFVERKVRRSRKSE